MAPLSVLACDRDCAGPIWAFAGLGLYCLLRLLLLRLVRRVSARVASGLRDVSPLDFSLDQHGSNSTVLSYMYETRERGLTYGGP